ncbi:MAG: queuine tRNA-ribosyltransferase [candidate division Zixibacteria bacterium SM23_81]|nr:MAG: queuine tRNA-ribosyltransferase [candidate division Zixibacteria bacterium SM23_81]
MAFSFRLLAQDKSTSARAAVMITSHGEVQTPAFMPVGTQGTVKTLSPRELGEVGAQIILSNSYHLYLRPGPEVIEQAGGLHRFIGWDKPILTDSGGYQVFSLADLNMVGEEGVTFQSHLDGSRHLFTPEKIMEIQHALGADIIMCLDECTAYPCTHQEAQTSAERTFRWASKSKEAHNRLSAVRDQDQCLFGIVQGSTYPDLRERSAKALVELDFQGYAVGGLSVGEPKLAMYEMIDATIPHLPVEKPRYLMGVGMPEDLVDAVSRGVDLFDCVIPTRNARNGSVFTHQGQLVVKNAEYARDFTPIDSSCQCYTCRHFSRAYLRHLFQAGEILAPRLATLHSVYFFMSLMRDMRRAIVEGRFDVWRRDFLKVYKNNSKN